MTGHLAPDFGPLDLDGLDAAAQSAALAHLGECAACGHAFARAAEALTGLALGLDPAPPPPALWERISAAVDGLGGLDRFRAPVARLLDLPEARAGEILASLQSTGAWAPGPVAECWVHEVQPGPRCAGALAAFVKITAGQGFPSHRHLGAEETLVLQGSYTTGDGGARAAGEQQSMAQGSTHALTAAPGEDLLYLAVVGEGIEIAGAIFRGTLA